MSVIVCVLLCVLLCCCCAATCNTATRDTDPPNHASAYMVDHTATHKRWSPAMLCVPALQRVMGKKNKGGALAAKSANAGSPQKVDKKAARKAVSRKRREWRGSEGTETQRRVFWRRQRRGRLAVLRWYIDGAVTAWCRRRSLKRKRRLMSSKRVWRSTHSKCSKWFHKCNIVTTPCMRCRG